MPERNDQRAPLTVHETAVRMQAHYAQTGAYRMQDVSRVLGDPRKDVSHMVTPQDSNQPAKNNLSFVPVHNFVRVA
ncbi:hypothetical protein LJR175_004406 [Variovorax sp. LjRoot175]|uniref:hypothetical protein n=1 Tax=Variovorax sp. LjRoot175 TaxID=3342276 RepID=UPI003ECDABE5